MSRSSSRGKGPPKQPTRHPEQIASEEFRRRKVDSLFPRSRFELVSFSLTLPQLRFAVLANVSGNMQTTRTRSVSEVFAARKSLPQRISLESGTRAIFISE